MDTQEGARTGLNNLGRGFNLHKKEYEEKVIEILRSGWYVLEKEIEAFEQEWADYCGRDDQTDQMLWLKDREWGFRRNIQIL